MAFCFAMPATDPFSCLGTLCQGQVIQTVGPQQGSVLNLIPCVTFCIVQHIVSARNTSSLLCPCPTSVSLYKDKQGSNR